MNIDHLKSALFNLALQSPAKEICGYICNEVIYRAENVSSTPETHFELDTKSTQQLIDNIAKGKSCCLYHSHVGNSAEDFSAEDAINMHTGLEIPWLVIHAEKGAMTYANPWKQGSYLGREWHWSWQNCSCLVREWYRRELGIVLDYFQLESPYAYFTENGWNKFEQEIERQGFQKVAEPRYGDLILMMIGRTQKSNHIAVFVDEEANQILHHCQDSLSRKAPYGRSYRKATTGIWRHASRL